MKPRGLLAAVIVLAALGGALYWSNRKQKADAAKPATDTRHPKILSIPEDQIKEVRLKKTGAETTVLRKGDDGKWQIAEPKPLRADQDAAKSLVSSLSNLNADKVVEDKAADLSPYGLNAPTLDVTVKRRTASRRISWWATTHPRAAAHMPSWPAMRMSTPSPASSRPASTRLPTICATSAC
jgi:hypothetical protein